MREVMWSVKAGVTFTSATNRRPLDEGESARLFDDDSAAL